MSISPNSAFSGVTGVATQVMLVTVYQEITKYYKSEVFLPLSFPSFLPSSLRSENQLHI